MGYCGESKDCDCCFCEEQRAKDELVALKAEIASLRETITMQAYKLNAVYQQIVKMYDARGGARGQMVLYPEYFGKIQEVVYDLWQASKVKEDVRERGEEA